MIAARRPPAGLDDDGVITFLRQVAPVLGEGTRALEACDFYEELRRKKSRRPAELMAVAQFKKLLRDSVTELGDAVRKLSADAGANELTPAIDAGVVQIDPLVAADAKEMLEVYMQKLGALIKRGKAYPVFDDATGELVRAGVAEGLLQVSRGNERRGRQAAVATDLLSRMPSLPRASMDQVLSVRRELETPLIRFRSTVIALARQLDAELFEDELDGEIDDLYLEQVAPALEDLAEAFTTDAYLRELAAATAEDIKWLFATGAGLTIGLLQTGRLPALAATAIGAGGVATSAAARATLTVRKTRDDARHRSLYFLYRANEQLRRC